MTSRGLEVVNKDLIIYLPNLSRGLSGRSYLAYLVEVRGPEIHKQVFVEAQKGEILDRVSLTIRFWIAKSITSRFRQVHCCGKKATRFLIVALGP